LGKAPYSLFNIPTTNKLPYSVENENGLIGNSKHFKAAGEIDVEEVKF